MFDIKFIVHLFVGHFWANELQFSSKNVHGLQTVRHFPFQKLIYAQNYNFQIDSTSSENLSLHPILVVDSNQELDFYENKLELFSVLCEIKEN